MNELNPYISLGIVGSSLLPANSVFVKHEQVNGVGEPVTSDPVKRAGMGVSFGAGLKKAFANENAIFIDGVADFYAFNGAAIFSVGQG